MESEPNLVAVVAMASRRRGRKPKLTWDNCCVCGQENGPIAPRGKTPVRLSLARFGKQGKACLTCYNRLAKQHKRDSKNAG
jgi:hypothetical protein